MPPTSGGENNMRTSMRIRGRERAVLDRRRIGRGDYFFLEQIGSLSRKRFLAFDPGAGPGGDFFLVQIWPNGPLAEQQIRVLQQLKDDSFPRVHYCQRRGDNLEVVTSWVEGISLVDYYENIRHGRRPRVVPGQAVRLIHGLANAVCKLHHKRQIAHGDIQPSNVIITSHPSRLVLIDFGSAWTAQSSAWREEGDGHNRFYAAPELQSGLPTIGFLADQFSVSVLFYELLTGKLPYGGLGGKAGRAEFAHKTGGTLVPPSTLIPNGVALPQSLRQTLDTVAMRGLALAPEKRYPQRNEWLNDLFQLSAQFRLTPQLTTMERLLTRVMNWVDRRRITR